MEEDGCKSEIPVKITVKEGKKPAEIFRTDLITAMKIPDHQLVTPGTYFDLSDTWKQEWERGVQVPVNKGFLPQPSFSISRSAKALQTEFRMPYKYVKSAKKKEKSPLYDLDDEDVEWLKAFNRSRKNKGLEVVDELLMENAIACLEDQCYTNMGETISTAKGLSIEYDEDIACDICRSPDCEDGNEILFCDVCDVAVHQACYGVQKVPLGTWVCKPCTQLLSDSPCLLCSTRGGAMKKTKTKGVEGWVHMSCAVWIPEVRIGNVEKMEPITRIETITPGRWNLLCYICKEKRGACIQCSVKTCVTAFHVTCGFDGGLHMETVWDDSAPDGVRHVCYCSKHTEKRTGRSPRKSSSSLQSPQKFTPSSSPPTTPSKSSSSFREKEEERENLRQNRLRGMEEEFYKYAHVENLANELKITTELATSFHRFWTLKRKAREDAALLPPTAEQQDRLCGRQIKPFQKATMEIERVVRLRQDLERIRNLCYMVEKREKLKRELTAAREAVFRKELEVVDDTSGMMSAEDVRWARSCCVKNFTEYEELLALELQCPSKPKVYKKRGRKPKRRSINKINGLVVKRVIRQSEGITSELSGECEGSDSADQNKEFCSGDVVSDHLDTRVQVACSSASSCDNTSNNASTLRKKPVTRLDSSNKVNMSSGSDFEEASTAKAKRRLSIRQFRLPKLSKSDSEVLVSLSGGIDSTESSSVLTQGSSPVQKKARLNGLNISARVNLSDFKNRSRRSCKDVAERRKRKRLFSKQSANRGDDEPHSPRTLRSRASSEQLTCNVVSEKRVCRPNGILISHNSENVIRSSSINDGNLLEEDDKVEVRLTRSRSRISSLDSPKSSKHHDTLYPGYIQSGKHGTVTEFRPTKSKNSLQISASSALKINGVLCSGTNDEDVAMNKLQRAQESLSNHKEVLDISSRTRSRSNTLDSVSSPSKKDIDIFRDVSLIFSAQNTEANYKKESAMKEAIAERCKTLRRQARLSDDLEASQASLYSPSKCSRFFSKLRQAATTSA